MGAAPSGARVRAWAGRGDDDLALDDYLASVHPRRLRPEDADGRSELARIFPSLSEFGADAPVVVEERWRSHRAVRELLALHRLTVAGDLVPQALSARRHQVA